MVADIVTQTPPALQATTPLEVIPGSGARVSPAGASEASEATKWP